MEHIFGLLQYSLVYGIGMSVVLGALFLTGAYFSPATMLRGYPADIKHAYGAPSVAVKAHQRLLAIPVFIVLVGTLAASSIQLVQLTNGERVFTIVFLNAFLILAIFNLVDLLVLDWLIFVTIQPRFVILPGTEGLPGYHDYAFHFRAFVKGVLGSLIFSLGSASVAFAAQYGIGVLS